MKAPEYKALREAMNLGVLELAELLGVTRQTIWEREKGNFEVRPEAEMAILLLKQRRQSPALERENAELRAMLEDFRLTLEEIGGPGRINRGEIARNALMRHKRATGQAAEDPNQIDLPLLSRHSAGKEEGS